MVVVVVVVISLPLPLVAPSADSARLNLLGCERHLLGALTIDSSMCFFNATPPDSNLVNLSSF